MGSVYSTEPTSTTETGPVGYDARSPFTMIVEFETTSAEATSEVLRNLAVCAECQIESPHPGAIVYNFVKPDPENQPDLLEFTEVYFNEPEYWAHVTPRFKFIWAILSGFKDAYRKNRRYVMYGNLNDGIIQSGSTFEGTPIEGEAGFVLNSNPVCIDVDEKEFRPVMIKLRVHVPSSGGSIDASVNAIRQISEALSQSAAEQLAVVFMVHRLNDAESPERFDIISVWANETRLRHFLDADGVGVLFGRMIDECVGSTGSVQCNVFGEGQNVCQDVRGWMSNVLGEESHENVNVNVRETDEGYVLHPQVRELLHWKPDDSVCVFL